MIPIQIRNNIEQVAANLDTMGRRHYPFAISMAMNRTAEEARDASRQRILQRGIALRSANTVRMVNLSIRIPFGQMSSKGKAQWAVESQHRIGGKGRTLLPWLEEGGERRSNREIGPPGVYGKAVAVPFRTHRLHEIPRNLYPSALRLQATRFTIEGNDGGGFVPGRLKGKRGTFMLPQRSGAGRAVIFQRWNKNHITPLFFVRPSVRVAPRRYFFPVVGEVAQRRFRANLEGALNAAIFSTEIGRNRGVSAQWRGGEWQPRFHSSR
jgi:hypothetical protein